MSLKAREKFIREGEEFSCGHAAEDYEVIRAESVVLSARGRLEQINSLNRNIWDSLGDFADNFFCRTARTKINQVYFRDAHRVFIPP